jgi:RNA 2',3'-cyclic 3'-phosphodiesterase
LVHTAMQARTECGGRAIAPDKIHLTLVFVGTVERAVTASLQSYAAALPLKSFELELTSLGYWPHNRIIWAGTETCPHELGAVVAALSRGLAGLGIRGEDRPYVPHVTLVRHARCAPQQLRMARLRWLARELVLVESVTDVSRYEVLARWPLV